jgi:asparagine synthase (glutamine-hydrolysing)
MAEMIRGWRATPPNSYFKEVKSAGAATRTTIDTRGHRVDRATYWEPFRDAFYPSIGAASESLAAAVRSAIAERTAIAERPVFFISGGADSRVMLFGAADRSKAAGVNIYEHAGAETRIARNLCASAGCRFIAVQRDGDYYPRQLSNIARWSGAMWSAEDSHYPGMEQHMRELKPDLVMTACTTDWLFKGYGMEKEHVPLLGRSLPFLRYLDRRGAGFLPNGLLSAPADLAKAIDERMDAWFAGCPDKLSNPHDRLKVEDRRIRPACYTVSVSGQIMYRIFPYDTFFADSRVAECYSRIHPDWKLNREVWGKAAARICTVAGDIIDANYGWRVDAGPIEKAFVFTTGWFGRRLKRAVLAAPLPADRPPPAGSWPDLGWYALHSATLKRLWHSITPEERERMRIITGADHWARPLEAWRSDGYQLFRLLTLLCHWRESGRRRERAGLPALKAVA